MKRCVLPFLVFVKLAPSFPEIIPRLEPLEIAGIFYKPDSIPVIQSTKSIHNKHFSTFFHSNCNTTDILYKMFSRTFRQVEEQFVQAFVHLRRRTKMFCTD